MCHPLYRRAMGLMGQRVYVHHVDGRMYHGILTHGTPQGMYLIPLPAAGTVSGAKAASSTVAEHAIAQSKVPGTDATQVFWGPGMFFGWGALAGLGAAAAFSPYWGW